MTAAAAASTGTVWERGRFDARGTGHELLFGRMYEDPAIELAAFRPGGRVLCISSAGCTAMALAPHHDVVALDLNTAQLAYAEHRFHGGGGTRGKIERIMDVARRRTPLMGWKRERVLEFLALADPAAQLAFWRQHLDTWRFRTAFDGLLSMTALRAVYAPPLLACLPPRTGAVMRGRLERGFALHPNRDNPFVRLLLLGEADDVEPPHQAQDVSLVHADAAGFLERAAPASFDGFALSNIVDGVDEGYRHRLFAAVRRAAAPGAIAVVRSFSEPGAPRATNLAARDRSLLWGVVEVTSAAALGADRWP